MQASALTISATETCLLVSLNQRHWLIIQAWNALASCWSQLLIAQQCTVKADDYTPFFFANNTNYIYLLVFDFIVDLSL